MIQQSTDSAYAEAGISADTAARASAPADSTAADSLNRPAEVKQEIAVLDTIAEIPAHPAPYLSGREPAARAYNPASDSAITGVMALLLTLLLFNFRHLHRLLASGAHELLSVRSRENVFDDRTANESRAGLILVILLCFSAAILLYFRAAWSYDLPSTSATAACIGKIALLCGGYYIFQYCAYSAVGYAFAPDRNAASQWVKGFTASMSYLSVCILGPALVALFYPSAAPLCAQISLCLFCVAKLVFVVKGFRIFYYNFLSLLYLILYLCSLEIIPAFFVYSLSLYLSGVDVMRVI